MTICIQMKASEQYFPVMLFIMLYKVVLTFESVDEIQMCKHSDESRAELPYTIIGYMPILFRFFKV